MDMPCSETSMSHTHYRQHTQNIVQHTRTSDAAEPLKRAGAGPSATLVLTLLQRAAPSPPGFGADGLLGSVVPVLSVLTRTKSDPELLSLMISLTTACFRSCSPMMRASMVLSAEEGSTRRQKRGKRQGRERRINSEVR